MERQGSGSIICIASASRVIGQKAQVVYNVSKHGVIGLVRCMSLDHASAEIRVNAVCPDTFKTPMLDALSGEQLANLEAMHPLGRLAELAEIAQMVLHLASERGLVHYGFRYFGRWWSHGYVRYRECSTREPYSPAWQPRIARLLIDRLEYYTPPAEPILPSLVTFGSCHFDLVEDDLPGAVQELQAKRCRVHLGTHQLQAY